jgi:hypothetical protein
MSERCDAGYRRHYQTRGESRSVTIGRARSETHRVTQQSNHVMVLWCARVWRSARAGQRRLDIGLASLPTRIVGFPTKYTAPAIYR